jgi:hypothetical protein
VMGLLASFSGLWPGVRPVCRMGLGFLMSQGECSGLSAHVAGVRPASTCAVGVVAQPTFPSWEPGRLHSICGNCWFCPHSFLVLREVNGKVDRRNES